MENIRNKNEYYFITRDKINSGCIALPSITSFKVVDEQRLSTFSSTESSLIMPKEFFKKINPLEDFDVKICIKNNNALSGYCPDQFINLGKVINETIYKSADALTHVFLSSGMPAVDFGEQLLVISSGMLLTKFTDAKIKDKLCKCILLNLFNHLEPMPFFDCEKFTMNNACGIEITCTICPSNALKSKITKEIGKYRI